MIGGRLDITTPNGFVVTIFRTEADKIRIARGLENVALLTWPVGISPKKMGEAVHGCVAMYYRGTATWDIIKEIEEFLS